MFLKQKSLLVFTGRLCAFAFYFESLLRAHPSRLLYTTTATTCKYGEDCIHDGKGKVVKRKKQKLIYQGCQWFAPSLNQRKSDVLIFLYPNHFRLRYGQSFPHTSFHQ